MSIFLLFDFLLSKVNLKRHFRPGAENLNYVFLIIALGLNNLHTK